MQIKISISNSNEINNFDEFVYSYIPRYINKRFERKVNPYLLSIFDKEFDIDTYSILRYALRNLIITKSKSDTYIVKIDTRLKYDGHSVSNIVSLVTYGTRQIRGYGIILDIFKEVSENIIYVYNAWLLGVM